MRAKTWGVLTIGLFAGAAFISAILIVKAQRTNWVWDHWDVVKPGVLYRSGQLTPPQLRAAVEKYRLRTVVNLQFPDDELIEERRICKEMAVDFINLPMPGDGLGSAKQFARILEIMDDAERHPILIHCARGTCRTGASVALYRLERDGWTPEDVEAELRRQTYQDHWLPGYIMGMTKRQPIYDLYPENGVEDRNAPSLKGSPKNLEKPSPVGKPAPVARSEEAQDGVQRR